MAILMGDMSENWMEYTLGCLLVKMMVIELVYLRDTKLVYLMEKLLGFV
jgi:hypothetical protein